MNYVHIIAVLAILQFFYFGILVGKARGTYGVKAPATSGPEGFERAFRVQMNTLEQLVAFLPALLLASLYWPNWIVACIGAVYLIGRFLYQRSYVTDPAKRGLGFLLTVIPTFVLLLAVLVGVVLAGGVFQSEVATASQADAKASANMDASSIPVIAPTADVAAAPLAIAADPVLSAMAFGKVVFGERLDEVAQRLGESVAALRDDDEAFCRLLKFKTYPGVTFMVENGVVTRMETSRPVATSIGYTVDASMAEIKAKIPGVVIEPHKYDPYGHYITLMSEDGKTAILMEEAEGIVTDIRGGLVPSVQYVEGCS